MEKQTALNELLALVKKIMADDVITPDEVNFIQDWIDGNAVLFIGDEYYKLILPLQAFVEDGNLSKSEIENLYIAIKRIAG